jgi:CheY-like chemotaxis protein
MTEFYRLDDLIFLDLRMPGLDGVQTLREIRKIDAEVPVYIVTAFHVEYFEQLKAASVDGLSFEVLQKPVGRDQIIQVTESALEDRAVQL